MAFDPKRRFYLREDLARRLISASLGMCSSLKGDSRLKAFEEGCGFDWALGKGLQRAYCMWI